MAEGGDYSTTVDAGSAVDGSDFMFDYVCTPCAADGSRFEGVQFCKTCDQFLCKTCTRYHQRLSKSHNLVPADSAQQTNVRAHGKPLPDATKCPFHPDRDIEMYCGTHDMVYCSLCIATTHRSCSGVEEIDDNIHKSNQSRLQQIVANIGRVHKKLTDIQKDKTTDLKALKTYRTDLFNEIVSLRKELNDTFDQLERKIKAELDEAVAKLEQAIRDHLSTADRLLTTTNERKSEFGNITDEKQMFIAEKIGQKVVSDTTTFLEKASSSKLPVLTFERNNALLDVIKMTDNFGKIVSEAPQPRQTRRRKYVVKSSDTCDVRLDTDGDDCTINAMCQLKDGTILLADYNNCKFKRLDQQLTVIDYCDLDSQPQGLCPISSTEVAVRFLDYVQFIRVGTTLQPGKTVQVVEDNDWRNIGVAFCNGNLWTCCEERCVYIYSTTGKFVKKLDKDSRGQNIFGENIPNDIAVSNDGNKVYVTAHDRVVVFNKNGEVIKVLLDARLDGAADIICVTEDDIKLVAGFRSKTIVMIGKDDRTICDLALPTDMLSEPYSVCYDKTQCRLLVGFANINNIQVYQLGD